MRAPSRLPRPRSLLRHVMPSIASGIVSTCASVRHGAQFTGSLGPNSTTTGTPKAAAMCAGPLSLPMKSCAPAMRLFTSASGALWIHAELRERARVVGRAGQEDRLQPGFIPQVFGDCEEAFRRPGLLG